jgi:protein SCO1/2
VNRSASAILGLALLGLPLVLPSCGNKEEGLLRYEELGMDFLLTDDEGQEYRYSENQGQVRLLFFGFTHCPDICPTTLNDLTKAFEILGKEGQEVETLFVSIDPERDTPERLNQYLGAFPIPVTGLTGSQEDIAEVAKAYGAFYERLDLDSALGYTMDHSTYLYLIDREGVVRYLFRYEDPPERIAAVVDKLL